MAIVNRVMFFIDGENLVMRFQNMKKQDRKPKDGCIHIENTFVWHSDIIPNEIRDIFRVSYYTSGVGDEDKLTEIKQKIKAVKYDYLGPLYSSLGGLSHQKYSGQLFPRVYKKTKQSERSKGVDINITIDMLDYARLENVDTMYLLSGDGDFIPLIEAVMRLGKRVNVMALSDGLNPQLKYCADEFECIDDKLFQW